MHTNITCMYQYVTFALKLNIGSGREGEAEYIFVTLSSNPLSTFTLHN